MEDRCIESLSPVTNVTNVTIVTDDKGENSMREPGDESENQGCDFFQTTGDCRAAHEIELMALPIKEKPSPPSPLTKCTNHAGFKGDTYVGW